MIFTCKTLGGGGIDCNLGGAELIGGADLGYRLPVGVLFYYLETMYVTVSHKESGDFTTSMPFTSE